QLTDLVQKKRTLEITASSGTEFANGKVATLMSGEATVRTYRTAGTPYDTAFFPRQKAADPPITTLAVEGLYMFKTGPDRQDATWRFLTWLVKPDVYHQWAVSGSFRLPLSPAWTKSAAYQAFLKQYPQQKVFVDQLPNAVPKQTTVYGDELDAATA